MEYFEENNKFFGLKGVIGRRNFIVNCLIIELLESLFIITPLIFATIFVSGFSTILTSPVKPLWFSIAQCIGGLISSGLYFPSVVRRVRDILGEQDDNRVFVIASTITVIIFMGYTPIANSFIGSWIILFTLLSLIFMKGKITGEKPKNEVIKFNWGAFFGTWIWGMINKVPKTLIILPLFLTAAWFPYMIICGLKGNEWVYDKNKEKIEDINLFHLAQKTQSIILTILSPVIGLVGIMLLSICIFSGIKLSAKFNPNISTWLKNYAQQIQIQSAESGFEKIEQKDGIYVFYTSPEEWELVKNSELLKQSTVKSAISYTLIKSANVPYTVENILKNVDLINQIKIYSEFNNEILAEINIDKDKAQELLKDINDNDNFKKAIELINSSVKINTNPSLP